MKYQLVWFLFERNFVLFNMVCSLFLKSGLKYDKIERFLILYYITLGRLPSGIIVTSFLAGKCDVYITSGSASLKSSFLFELEKVSLFESATLDSESCFRNTYDGVSYG
jgi:hypothetical protein